MKKDVGRVFLANLIKMITMLIVSFAIPAILSVEEYGYYKLFALYASYIGVFHLGYCDGIFLQYGGKKLQFVDKNGLSNEHKTIILYELFLTLLVSGIGILRRNYNVFFLGLNFLPSTLFTFYTYLYQATGRFDLYANAYGFSSLIRMIINLLLVFVFKADKGVDYIFAIILIDILVFAREIYIFKNEVKTGYGTAHIRTFIDLSRMGILLMIGNMSYTLFSSIDKWFIKILIDLNCFALYSFGSQLLSVINMFVNPIGLTLYNYMSIRKSRDFEYRMKTILLSIIFFMLIGAFVLKYIVHNFMIKYMEATPVIGILFLGHAFQLLNTTIYINLFKVYRMQRKYFKNLVLIFGISILLNGIFCILFGASMMSIASATAVSMVIWSYLNLKSFPHLRLKFCDLSFLICCSGLFLLAYLLLDDVVGLFVYATGYIILLYLLMKDCFNMSIIQIKSFKERLSRKGKERISEK